MNAATSSLTVAVLVAAGLAAVPTEAAAEPTAHRVVNDGGVLITLSTHRATTRVSGAGGTGWDFDGDGIDDLAAVAGVGVRADPNAPWPVVPGLRDEETLSGPVVVRYSSAPRQDVVFAVWPPSRGGGAMAFGQALGAGDVNGDGFDDLVIGDDDYAPRGRDALQGAGAVWVFLGSRDGLQLTGARHFGQDTAGVPGEAEQGDWFGSSVAVGDLDADGYDDVAVGAHGEDVGRRVDAGAVTVLYGSRSGITSKRSRTLTQDTHGIPGTAEKDDYFGSAVAIGRVGGDRYADLVVGARGENSRGSVITICASTCTGGTGAVSLVRGGPDGIRTSGAVTIGGAALARSALRARAMPAGTFLWRVGNRVAVGDLDGDRRGDVVVAASAAQSAAAEDYVGAVVAVSGSRGGLDSRKVRAITRDTAGVPGGTQSAEWFGRSLAVGDVTGDGRADVVVGSDRRVGKLTEAGAITILRGSSTGLTGARALYVTQNSPGVPGGAESGDRFGAGVRVLSLDGRGRLDIAVSAPGERLPSDPVRGDGSGTVTALTMRGSALQPLWQVGGREFVVPGAVDGIDRLHLGGY